MFSLGLHYLNGWSMAAADGARKQRAEWPPHPDRIFMALAAAWFETGEDPLEGKALRWLEALPPPEISASDADNRATVVSYVPVNDQSLSRKAPASGDLKRLKNAGLAQLPEYRSRQPRSFPVAIPHDPTVHLIWPGVELGAHHLALERLVSKVTHVGHSASFVQMWLEARPPPSPTWIPATGIALQRLRVTSPGRLKALEARMNRSAWIAYHDLCSEIKQARTDRKAMKYIKSLQTRLKERFPNGRPVSLRPAPGRWQGYDRPQETRLSEAPGSVFDPQLIVLGIKGKRVSLPATLKLTAALRGLLMRISPEQPPPEWFSGHCPDGTPTAAPHLALTPLPFVGSQHADGRIMGLAMVLPAGLDQQEAGHCLEPFLRDSATGLPREHTLFDGKWFECAIELETRERPPKNLNPDTWTRKSRVWVSVTPVVLNRHFDGKDKWERAAESVKDACLHIGLPRPREVLLHPVSLLEGAPHAREYPQLMHKNGSGRRSHSHAVIVFDEPVCGPVLLGAGRFRGYGLCRPVDEKGEDRD